MILVGQETTRVSCSGRDDGGGKKDRSLGYILRVQPTRWDVSQFIYFCKTFYMFRKVFSYIIRSSTLHVQRQAFVRPILLPAASLDGMELVPVPGDGRKTRLKHVEHLTEINKLRNVASFWLYSEHILAMYGPTSVKGFRKLTEINCDRVSDWDVSGSDLCT